METPPRTNTTTSASPYRLGNWTITQLKEELKQRNLSPAGKKQELIERLERYEHDAALATPRHGRRSAADRSPSKSRARSVSRKRVTNKPSGINDEPGFSTPRRVGRPKKAILNEWTHTPLKVATPPAQKTPGSVGRRATPSKSTPSRQAKKNASKTAPFIHSVPAFAALMALLFALFASSILVARPDLAPVRAAVESYLYWAYLGLVNFYTFGANTWISHLAPFIARVSSTAYVCKTTSFSTADLNKFSCPKDDSLKSSVGVCAILMKVALEVLSWGLGEALAEIVPFAVATAFVATLSKSKGPISAKLSKYIGVIKSNFGPAEAFVLASFPNPLFELTGLLSGLSGLSIAQFALSILLGKVLVRGLIQALMVIVVFSKDIIEPVLGFLNKYVPALAASLSEEIVTKRNLYQQPADISTLSQYLNTFSKLTNVAIIVFMAVHALLTLVRYRR